MRTPSDPARNTGEAEGALLMHELAGLEVNAKAVERTAKRIGQEVAHEKRPW